MVFNLLKQIQETDLQLITVLITSHCLQTYCCTTVCYNQYCCSSGLHPLFIVLKQDHYVSGTSSAPIQGLVLALLSGPPVLVFSLEDEITASNRNSALMSQNYKWWMKSRRKKLEHNTPSLKLFRFTWDIQLYKEL